VTCEGLQRFLLGVLIGIPLGIYATRRSYLEKRAAILSIFFSGLYFSAGLGVFITSLFFFFSSSLLTKLNFNYKKSIGASEREGGRSLMQVVGAGGVAASLSAIHLLSPYSKLSYALITGIYAAIASSNADTWAAEVGSLSKSKPRLITKPSQRVEPGTSGGVTLLGTLGSASGALLSAAIAILASSMERPGLVSAQTFLTIFLCGWLGEVLDSLTGATLQIKYYCPQCRALTDRKIHTCGNKAVPISGCRFITNEVTNLIATSIVSTGAVAFSLLQN